MPAMKYVMGRMIPMTDAEQQQLEELQASIVVPRYISKTLITQRLIDAGKIDEAYAALQSDAGTFARWFAPDRPVVDANNSEVLALLQAIGADPDVILA